MPYQRVTAVVELKQRKPRLRGTSITHVPVDFLVAPEHEHADRFRHIGQRLLIEATIAADTQRMNSNHPDLEGIDDPRRKAQLQVLRETVVTATLGEFPDAEAERAYEAWVKAGRPRPERQGRVLRATGARRSSAAPEGTPAPTSGHLGRSPDAVPAGAGNRRNAEQRVRTPR